jgi:biopolymer transport protein ExbD
MTQPAGPGGGAPPAPPHKGAPIVTYKAELRRAIRRNAHEQEVNFLNITAMLDIMTIILVFLLKTLGESSAAVPQSDDLRLPASIMKQAPAQEGVLVTISKTQILVVTTRSSRCPAVNRWLRRASTPVSSAAARTTCSSCRSATP